MPRPQPDWPESLDEFRAWHERQTEVWEFIYGVAKLRGAGLQGAHGDQEQRRTSARQRACSNRLSRTGRRRDRRGRGVVPDPGRGRDCSPLDFTTPRVAEPIVIVEVLSPSNQADDTGRKLALYLRIPSLRHYLVIEQERRQIVHHQRRDDLGGAFLTNIAPPDPLRLDPPGSALPLAAFYEGVPVV